MNSFFESIQQGSTFGQALVLMAGGILFVFATQVIFYVIIKLWPRSKDNSQDNT